MGPGMTFKKSASAITFFFFTRPIDPLRDSLNRSAVNEINIFFYMLKHFPTQIDESREYNMQSTGNFGDPDMN